MIILYSGLDFGYHILVAQDVQTVQGWLHERCLDDALMIFALLEQASPSHTILIATYFDANVQPVTMIGRNCADRKGLPGWVF